MKHVDSESGLPKEKGLSNKTIQVQLAGPVVKDQQRSYKNQVRKELGSTTHTSLASFVEKLKNMSFAFMAVQELKSQTNPVLTEHHQEARSQNMIGRRISVALCVPFIIGLLLVHFTATMTMKAEAWSEETPPLKICEQGILRTTNGRSLVAPVSREMGSRSGSDWSCLGTPTTKPNV